MQWRTWQINFEMHNGEFNINGFVRILAEGEAFAANKLTVTANSDPMAFQLHCKRSPVRICSHASPQPLD